MAISIPLYLNLLEALADDDYLDERVLYNDLFKRRATPSRLVVQAPQYLRPWYHSVRQQNGVSNVVNNKDELKVHLDLQQFYPEEISVKVVDNYLVVDGKHEERQDEHGFISRQFQRRYLLPDDVDPQAVASSISSDGVLSVSAPKKKSLESKERVVPIVFTNQPSIKAEKKKEGEKMQQ